MDELTRAPKFPKPDQSRWLRKSSRAMGLSVKSLADELGVSPRTINARENESNSNLPSRDKLFHYMVLLLGQRAFAEPARLTEISNVIDDADERSKPKTLSRFFARLSHHNQSIVNVLIRTLYRVQNRHKH
jgi:transcriptional regulator with XRE-family HTH domain